MQKEVSWQAFEYEYKPKSANWFWVVWILAFGIFFTAYLFTNILFGILILTSAFCISIFTSRKPNLIKISLTPTKITIGNKEIDIQNIESFWIKNQKILLKPIKKISPFTIIPLNPKIDKKEIKEYLLEYLEEVEHQESIFQIIFDRLF